MAEMITIGDMLRAAQPVWAAAAAKKAHQEDMHKAAVARRAAAAKAGYPVLQQINNLLVAEGLPPLRIDKQLRVMIPPWLHMRGTPSVQRLPLWYVGSLEIERDFLDERALAEAKALYAICR